MGVSTTRRRFLHTALWAGGAAWVLRHLPLTNEAMADPVETVSQVSLTGGADHADNVFRALQFFKRRIAAAIGNRPVLIKPNNVIGTSDGGHGDVLLSDTPVQSIEAILEFLQSIGKHDVVVAEACATDPTMVAFQNCGYFYLAQRYPVRFMDLSQEGHQVISIWNGAGRKNIRVSKMLLDPKYFVISAPKPKTHNNVVITLSLKNIVMGSPIADVGVYRSIGNCRNDKSSMHGTSNQDLNDNLHLLAPQLAPDLAVIDGFDGMEGNGPCWGTAVPQRFALASLDWLAADRVAVELMGVPVGYPAYLNYCYQTGLGQYDLDKIDVMGGTIDEFRRTYRLHDNIATQLGMRTTPRAS
jgi:uncharacterized protein (DUF362 family)